MANPVRVRLPRSQRGAALFLILLLLLVGGGVILVSQLKSANLEQRAQRDTAAAMAEAKQALLGRAAADNDAGTLPCPSMNGTLGQSDTTTGGGGIVCGNGSYKSNLGWLPWNTLAASALRDGSQGLLWYMLGSGYVDKGTYSPPPYAPSLTVNITTVDVNPATLAETPVSVQTVKEVAAAILAPGQPLSGQDRSGTAQTDSSRVAAYLEVSADPVANTLNLKQEVRRDTPPVKYNDQYRLVTVKDVLNVSTQRISKEVAVALDAYYAAHGSYPPNGWLPSGGDWVGRYQGWVTPDPSTGKYPMSYMNTGTTSGKLYFTGCAAPFTLQQTPSGAAAERAGYC